MLSGKNALLQFSWAPIFCVMLYCVVVFWNVDQPVEASAMSRVLNMFSSGNNLKWNHNCDSRHSSTVQNIDFLLTGLHGWGVNKFSWFISIYVWALGRSTLLFMVLSLRRFMPHFNEICPFIRFSFLRPISAKFPVCFLGKIVGFNAVIWHKPC